MFRMQQRPVNRSSKAKERIDFKFSNFQALQVPKGWDRLYVSLISVETGKTLAKSGKAMVRNGSCQWAETISESIYMSNDATSKGQEECHVRLVVSMGTTRSSALGEVTINMASYASSRVSTAAVSQPLKKCSYGTVLQVKIQCQSRRLKNGDEESKHSNSIESNPNIDQPDPDRKSNRLYSGSNGSSEEKTTTTSHPRKPDSKESSRSPSGSVQSFDSAGSRLSVENVFKGEDYDSHTMQPRGSYESSPIPDDYSAGDDSPPKQPSLNSRLYSGEDFRNEVSVSRSSTTNIGSSTSLLEAAEDTIEELRAEAKMWERNARKLMIDLDMSKKEFSDLSKKQAELVMQLSAAYAEQDGLKREVEKLKEELRKSETNQATREDVFPQSESLIQIQMELKNEITHQQKLSNDLGQQLKQSQESNIALVSVLQELEETIEQQKIELENLSSQKVDSTGLEDSVDKKSEDNMLSQLEQLQESEKKLKAEVQLLERALRDKIDELKNEQNSNSEILFSVEKDYESKMSVNEERDEGQQAMLSGSAKGTKLKVSDENNAALIQEIESLKEKVEELEKDCTELTDENLELLYKLKDMNKTDIRKCASLDSISSEHPNLSTSDGSEVSDPKYQISHLEEEIDDKVNRQEKQHPGFKSEENLAEVLKQIDMAFHHLSKPWYPLSYHESMTSSKVKNASDGNTNTSMSCEYILSSLLELNRLLAMRIAESEEILKNQETKLREKSDSIANAEAKMKATALEIQEFEMLVARSEDDKAALMKELDQKITEFDVKEANLASKEQEIDFLLQQRQELEDEISGLQEKINHLEQNMVLVVRERNSFAECAENLQNEIAALHSTASSHTSANDDLERDLEELERKRTELEHTLSGLQEENMKLQESIVDLETQVRQVGDEKKMCQHEAENFKNVAVSLQDEIKKLKVEMDTLISDRKQKSKETESKLVDAQEEYKTLQASVASYEQENMKLQGLNSELNIVNQGLETNCSSLATQLREMKKKLSDCTEKIKSLEKHLISVLDNFTLKENSLKSQIDELVKENDHQKETFVQEGSLCQMFLEQSTEFESLQKEVERLTKEVSSARYEKEQISVEASGEVSRLLADKAELRASLQEAKLRAESAENKLNAALEESELQVRNLTDHLSASQQSLERLMVDHDRILKWLASYKRREETLKTGMNDLELKLTISDYECQQLTEEIVILKAQLQSISDLQAEVSNLKSELKECRLERGRLELALKTVSADYEELKAEKISLSGKITIFQEAMSEFEECKQNRLVLEEKLLQMEKELNAKEILCLQNEDLKNEITEIKRANMQFQQKMYRLEEERDECLKKAQTLEDDLKLVKEKSNIFNEGANYHDVHNGGSHAMSGDHTTNRQLHEYEISEVLDENIKSCVQSGSYAAASKKSTMSGELVPRERYERTKSSLQTELKDLRERYLEMSLKYAEVEAQREDLVMKLKATRPGRRWFS